MNALVDLLSIFLPAAAFAFAGYQHGRRVEQGWWTELLINDPTVVILRAKAEALTAEEPRHE